MGKSPLNEWFSSVRDESNLRIGVRRGREKGKGSKTAMWRKTNDKGGGRRQERTTLVIPGCARASTYVSRRKQKQGSSYVVSRKGEERD